MGILLNIRHNWRLWSYALKNIRKLSKMTNAPKESEMPYLTVFEVKEKLERKELILIDVRSKNDFHDCH